MNRLVTTVVLLLAVTIGAFWFMGNKAKQLEMRQKAIGNAGAPASAPGAASAPRPTVPVATAAPAPRAIGYGLSYGLVVNAKAPADLVELSCGGEPNQYDRPLRDQCNPQMGDTSCRTILPVACTKPLDSPAPASSGVAPMALWVGATQPIMGAIVDSEATGNAMCEKELGQGWHMAEYGEVNGQASSLQGKKGLGIGGNNRYWILARNRQANCWNSPP